MECSCRIIVLLVTTALLHNYPFYLSRYSLVCDEYVYFFRSTILPPHFTSLTSFYLLLAHFTSFSLLLLLPFVPPHSSYLILHPRTFSFAPFYLFLPHFTTSCFLGPPHTASSYLLFPNPHTSSFALFYLLFPHFTTSCLILPPFASLFASGIYKN